MGNRIEISTWKDGRYWVAEVSGQIAGDIYGECRGLTEKAAVAKALRTLAAKFAGGAARFTMETFDHG